MADPNSKNTPIPIKNLYPRIFEFRKFESQIFEIQDGGSKFEKMLHFQWKNFVQRFSEVSEFECDVEFSVFKMAHKISKNTLPIFLNFNSPRWIYHLQFQKSNLIFNFSELKIPSPNLIKFQIFYKFHPLSWISKIWHSNSAQIQFFFSNPSISRIFTVKLKSAILNFENLIVQNSGIPIFINSCIF